MAVNKWDFPPLPSQRATKPKTRMSRRHREVPGSNVNINDLPDELIVNILDYVPGVNMGDFQLPTLLSLSRVNRRLRNIVIESLFQTYDSHFCEPYTFLRTVITNPQLANFVRNVDITNGTMAHADRKPYRATAQDKKIIKEGLRKLEMPDWKVWAMICNELNPDLETLHAAILMHVPNITSLFVHSTGFVETQKAKWLELLQVASNTMTPQRAHSFQHLRSIRFEANGISVMRMAPLFRLPSLRQLSIIGGVHYILSSSETISKLKRMISPAGNDIEVLHLEQSFYHRNILSVLLASPRQLKEFEYGVDSDLPLGVQDALRSITQSNLYTALEHQRSSLEKLHLPYDGSSARDYANSMGLHGNLHRLDALLHLRCPTAAISDPTLVDSAPPFGSLPPMLKTLHISDGPTGSIEHGFTLLEYVAKNHQSCGPKLEEVRFSPPFLSREFERDLTQLVALFSRTGINFVVEEAEEDDDWANDESDSSHSSDEVDLYSDEE